MRISDWSSDVCSSDLNGRGGLTLDLRTGTYAVMLDGKLDRYLIPGIGIVDVETRLKVVPGAPRGSMLTGTAKAWVRRLDNAFFRNIAGGLPVIETSLARGPDRILRSIGRAHVCTPVTHAHLV